jgi:hypothetical protein
MLRRTSWLVPLGELNCQEHVKNQQVSQCRRRCPRDNK